MVRKYPHEITIYAGGPLTNLALAIAMDPEFASLSKELVVMGGSINPDTDRKVNLTAPRREFNFWWDPEATRMVFRAHWPKITVTTVDISIKTWMSKAMLEQIGHTKTPVALYLAKWGDEEYMWDELAAAAWLDPSLITLQQQLYMDISIDHGSSYGDTLVWLPGTQPSLGEQLVNVQLELDKDKFYRLFVELMTRPTPGAKATN
jgi:purine nucleosidase